MNSIIPNLPPPPPLSRRKSRSPVTPEAPIPNPTAHCPGLPPPPVLLQRTSGSLHKRYNSGSNIKYIKINTLIIIVSVGFWIIYYFSWFSPKETLFVNSVTANQVTAKNAEQVAKNIDIEAAELNVETKVLETETREARARAEEAKADLDRLNANS